MKFCITPLVWTALFFCSFLISYAINRTDSDHASTKDHLQQGIEGQQFADRLLEGASLATNAYERHLNLIKAIDRDPKSMWEHINSCRRYEDYWAAKWLTEEFIQKDPFLAFEQSWKTPGRDRLEILSSCLQTAFNHDTELGLKMLEKIIHLEITLPSEIPDIREHPERYAERIGKMSTGDTKRALMREVAAAWQKSDSEAALEWASKLPPETQIEALKGVFKSWLTKDFDEEGMAFFDREIHGQLRTKIAAQWVSQVARKDPDEAFEWIDQYMSGFGEENMKSLVIQTAAKDNPELAVQYIDRIGPGLQGHRAITGEKVLRVWAEQDSRAAAQWVIDLPEDQFPEKHPWLVNLSIVWFTKDPEGVIAYIEQGEDVPVQFVERVGRAYWKADEHSARKWLNSLPDAYRAPVTKAVENFSYDNGEGTL